MLTEESTQLIKELISKTQKKDLLKNKDLKKIFNYLDSILFDYDKPNHTESNGSYPSSNFMSSKLQKELTLYTCINSFSWIIRGKSNITCKLNIYSKTNSISEININLLIYAISFLFSLSNKKRKTTIHLILLPDKKIFKETFTKENINSGSCYFNDIESEICIWRQEECIKVLFHECIHALFFYANLRMKLEKKIIKNYEQKYNILLNSIDLNEIYTEICAKIINCYFITKISSLINSEKDKYYSFCEFLSIEREFCFQQSSKIQTSFKKKSFNINKDTNTFEYYLATAEIFQNFDHFLKMISKQKQIFYLKNDRQFINFLMECKKIPLRKVNKKSKIYKTFRMSATELTILINS